MRIDINKLPVEQQLRLSCHYHTTPFLTVQTGPRTYNLIFAGAHIERVTHGALEFSPDSLLWERGIIPHIISRKIEDDYGKRPRFMREPPCGIVPPLLVVAEIHSYTPIKPDNHCGSHLLVVWFADFWPTDILADLTKQLEGIDWEKHAQNYYFD